MAITLKPSVNKALKETTVTAYDERGEFICCETVAGTTAGVAKRLTEQVRRQAESMPRTRPVAFSQLGNGPVAARA